MGDRLRMALVGSFLLVTLPHTVHGESRTVWIGTYSQRGSGGIYALQMDMESGRLGAPAVAAKATNPSFLALHPNGKFLYAVAEIGQFGGKPGGGVRGFALGGKPGELAALNEQPTGGAAPCHLAVDASGRNLVVANYSDGNVAVFPLGEDGNLKPMSQLVRHEGAGPNKARQEKPHAHGVTFDPTSRYVFVPDLGTDRIMGYSLDSGAGTLTDRPSATGVLAPGAGPRHFAFHPSGVLAYSVNELDSTITAFRWNASEGTLTKLASASTLPPGCTSENTTAELAVHPSGRFLYASNRGHDSIAVFALDAATGSAVAVQHEPCGGETPRCFAVDPAGRWLLCANQKSDNLVLFRIDAATGRLTRTDQAVAVPSPVCVLF